MREKYLRGLFNQHHVRGYLKDLEVKEETINNILNFFLTYGKSKF
jgi:hypothetical protein